MKATTSTIRFDLDKRLNEYATIECNNGIWGVETSTGYSTWGCIDFDSFDKAYNKLKSYEKESLKELKYLKN